MDSNITKKVTVTLFKPSAVGESFLTYENVVVTYHDKEIVRFTSTEEKKDQATIRDYTSTLPYLIEEVMTGPKTMLGLLGK